MTCNTSAIACCCSSASRVSAISRAFSIARLRRDRRTPGPAACGSGGAVGLVGPCRPGVRRSVPRLLLRTRRVDYAAREIARHHRIGHGSGEQLLDETMYRRLRPAGLACRAQGFGEAFRHDIASRRGFHHRRGGSIKARGLCCREETAATRTQSRRRQLPVASCETTA